MFRSASLAFMMLIAACAQKEEATPTPAATPPAPVPAPKPAPAEVPTPSPADATGCRNAATGVEAFVVSYEVQGGGAEQAAKDAGQGAGALVAARCTEDRWPADVAACFAAWDPTKEGIRREPCHERLPPLAADRLKKDGAAITALWTF